MCFFLLQLRQLCLIGFQSILQRKKMPFVSSCPQFLPHSFFAAAICCSWWQCYCRSNAAGGCSCACQVPQACLPMGLPSLSLRWLACKACLGAGWQASAANPEQAQASSFQQKKAAVVAARGSTWPSLLPFRLSF